MKLAEMSSGAEEVRNLRRPSQRLLGVYILRTLALCVLGPWFLVALAPLYFKYKTLRFRFDQRGVGVSWGLLWKRETYLAYSRIQDIHVSRGLFERWLSVASIHVQTASGNSAAEMSFPGLDNHEAVRDYLYSKMRRTSENAPQSGAPASKKGPSQQEELQLTVLREILGEIRRLRTQLDASSATDSENGA